MRLVVTGGAGVVGSAFVRNVLATDLGVQITVLDKSTYAGNLDKLAAVHEDLRYRFFHGDIGNAGLVRSLVKKVDAIVSFAAETHVDRSIMDAGTLIDIDVRGTWVLLEAARHAGISRFVQVSTDEVYGEVAVAASRESDPLRPRSPYAASKARGDLMVQAY